MINSDQSLGIILDFKTTKSSRSQQQQSVVPQPMKLKEHSIIGPYQVCVKTLGWLTKSRKCIPHGNINTDYNNIYIQKPNRYQLSKINYMDLDSAKKLIVKNKSYFINKIIKKHIQINITQKGAN